MPNFNFTTDIFINGDYVAISIYIPIFLIALIANLLVIVIVIKFNYMRNPTNYFLVNLSVADLLVTIVCMPNAMWSHYHMSWPFGYFACKISRYLQYVSIASSIFTITTMALDRYMNIARPFSCARWFNKKTTVIVIICLWIIALLISSPAILTHDWYYDDVVDMSFCFEDWKGLANGSRQAMGVIWFVLLFAVPGLTVTSAYCLMGKTLCSVKPPFENNSVSTQQSYRIIRERKRVAWILLILALLFAICWMPLHIETLIMDLDPTTIFPERPYLLLLGHANSALNPVIYCIMSKNFRKSVKEILCKRTIRFFTKKSQRLQWAGSSASSQRPLQKINMATPPHSFPNTLTRNQSTQRSTKTCAV